MQQTTFINIFHCFSEKIRLDVSSESARQRIHRKHQASFSLKDNSKKLKYRLLQILFGALRIKEEGKTENVQVSSPEMTTTGQL